VENAWRETGTTDLRVYVKADASLPYGRVYPLIIAMHELGIAGVDLGTAEKKSSEEVK
jgi:biopolymer transport protein ExbD